jgi:hypothetical protein
MAKQGKLELHFVSDSQVINAKNSATEKNKILKYLISNSLQIGQKTEFNLKKYLFLYN